MKNFLFIYVGGDEPQGEESESTMQEWMNWFTSLGDKVANGGFPILANPMSTNGQSNLPSSLPITGYSVIKAENMDEALEIAKGCPHTKANGQVHVFQEMELG